MSTALYRVAGSSVRFLVTSKEVAGEDRLHVEMIWFGRAPWLDQVLPAFRKLCAEHWVRFDGPSDEDLAALSVGFRRGMSGGRDWQLTRTWEATRRTSIGTIVVTRQKRVAAINQSKENTLNKGLSGPMFELLMLIRLAGEELTSLTRGWEEVELIEEEVRFAEPPSLRVLWPTPDGDYVVVA